MNKDWYKNEEETQLAAMLIQMEEDALKKWFNGDSSGYRELWSKKNFSYFDAVCKDRIDDHDVVSDQASQVVDGNLYAKHYEVRNARVQLGVDMAVLTYQLYSETNIININYNCIEVFQKEEDGWHVIHSTWSIIRPMEMEFSAMKTIV
jgi:hypothetical protein